MGVHHAVREARLERAFDRACFTGLEAWPFETVRNLMAPTADDLALWQFHHLAEGPVRGNDPVLTVHNNEALIDRVEDVANEGFPFAQCFLSLFALGDVFYVTLEVGNGPARISPIWSWET